MVGFWLGFILNWIGSFAVGLLFPVMTAAMSQAVFAIFGLSAGCGFRPVLRARN